MTVTIRRKTDALRASSAEDDVTSRLRDCHARIRAHLAEAVAVARSDELEPRRTGARAVLRYFTEALPLHAADEDVSVASSVGPSLATLVERLAREHVEIDGLVATLSTDWARWAGGERGLATDVHAAALERLDRLFRAHLELEETVLFPAIDRLPATTRRSIVQAMAARRRVE